MNDKNEKTFSDLFSSANKDNEENNKSLALENKSLTFDNLFDRVDKEDNQIKKDKEPGLSDIFSSINKKDEKQDNLSIPTPDNNLKTENSSVLADEKKDNFFESNSIFNINPFQEEKENISILNEKKEEELPSSLEEKQENKSQNESENNIFMSLNDNKKEDIFPKEKSEPSNTLSEIVEEKDEKKVDDFWEKPDIKDEDTFKKSISPFFDAPEQEDKETENPFFLEKINLIENEDNHKKSSNISLSNTKHFNVKVVKKKEPLFKFILGVISYALFIWLLLIGVTLLVYVLDIKIRAAKGDYSSPTFNAYVVLTGSMLPEIQVYDVVVTKKVDASSLEEGDVITFASADTRFLNTIITHRIIKKNYDAKTKTYSFQTKGDNNNVADNALVPQSNIYGKVILKIPKLGYLQEFLATDGGWIIVILIPCLTVVSYDIVKLAKGLKRKKYKNIKVQK